MTPDVYQVRAAIHKSFTVPQSNPSTTPGNDMLFTWSNVCLPHAGLLLVSRCSCRCAASEPLRGR